mgnify:CR=1 FL=1
MGLGLYTSPDASKKIQAGAPFTVTFDGVTGGEQCRPLFIRNDNADRWYDEIHVEMASREFSELELIRAIAAQKDVAVGIIDVKSYYIETVEDVAARVRACLQFAPADRLSFAPDCGLKSVASYPVAVAYDSYFKDSITLISAVMVLGGALAAGHRHRNAAVRRATGLAKGLQ